MSVSRNKNNGCMKHEIPSGSKTVEFDMWNCCFQLVDELRRCTMREQILGLLNESNGLWKRSDVKALSVCSGCGGYIEDVGRGGLVTNAENQGAL